MSELHEFNNGVIQLPVQINENGSIKFDAESAALGLGITQGVNSKIYIRWERVNSYLSNDGEFSPQVGKGDYISESQFYKLAFKANNKVAERFQDWVTDEVLPAIRRTGSYSVKPKKPLTGIEQLKLAEKGVLELDERVTDLEENQTIAPGEYTYISNRVRHKVSEYMQVSHLSLNNKQRGKLYQDISRGLNEVTGVKTRTQLRKKDFKTADEYITNWSPSVATLTIIKQMNGETDDQTALGVSV